MTTELQNKAWSCLPKEFKEEVKELYDSGIKMMDIRPSASEIYANKLSTLEGIFGIHNLTSDAEGEEILMAPRKKVQEMYAHYDAISTDPDRPKDYIESCYEFADGIIIALDELFGSKCLPDEAPKPAEPKFKVGDKASYVCSPTLKHKCTVTKVMQNEHSGKWEYNVMFEWGKPGIYLPESDLEPYTEPKEEIRNSRISPEAGGSWHASMIGSGAATAVLNDSSDDRRLNIAAMAMQSILSNPVSAKSVMVPGNMDISVLTLVEKAVKIADALIAECGKGGLQ